MTIRQWRLLGRTVFVGGAATAGLMLGWAGITSLKAQAPNTGFVTAEQPAAQEAPAAQRNYMRQSVIDLPINMKEEARALIQEIHLYVKEQPTAPWTLRDKGNASATTFRFQTSRDGDYAFTMVTVDKQGRTFPKDLQNEPAGLVVVIDTQKPTVAMTYYGDAPEGHLVHCEVKDANVDLGRVTFSYQSGDKVFRRLDPMPGRAGVYCIPAQAVSTGMVRLVAEDLAGNLTTVEEHISKLPTRSVSATGTQQTSVNPPMNVDPKPAELKKPSLLPDNVRDVKDADPPPPRILPSLIEEPTNVTPIRPMLNEGPRFPSPVEEPAKVNPMRPDGTENPRFLDETTSVPPTVPAELASFTGPGTLNVETKTVTPTPLAPAPVKTEVLAKRQIVNNSKLYLDYQIENANANVQSRVEVWLTRDHGKSWQKHTEDMARKSPVEVQLPGEGVFGLTLAVTNGRPTSAPTGADAADMWIEVDTTKPTAQISSVKVSHEKGQPCVDIQWSVSDSNLSDAPVELYFAPTPQGKWLPIAKGLKANGQYRWTPPVEIGGSAHVRLIAHDAAGNTSICDTLGAVTLEDPSRPRITIRNVRTEAPPAVTPTTPAPAPAPFQIIQPSRVQ